MKKFIAVVLLVAVFATLGLTACGSKNDNTATTTAPQGTSGETKATVKTAKDGVLTMVKTQSSRRMNITTATRS